MKWQRAYHSERFGTSANDGPSMISHGLRVFRESLFLLLQVAWIDLVRRPTQMRGRRYPIRDPSWASNEICHVSSWQICHLRHDLNTRWTIANDRDAFVGIVEVVVPSRWMRDLSLEVLESRNGWPLVMPRNVVSDVQIWKYGKVFCKECNDEERSLSRLGYLLSLI